MAVENDVTDVAFQHETIVKNMYQLSAGPLLSFLSKVYSIDKAPFTEETEAVKTHIYWGFDRTFNIHLKKSDGHECIFKIIPSPRSNDRIRIQCSVPMSVLSSKRKNSQAIGLPYWFHRLILLYSKTIRTNRPAEGTMLPHCSFPTFF
jgi:hypothetical protein